MTKIEITRVQGQHKDQTHFVSVTDGNRQLIEGTSFASSEIAALLVAGSILNLNNLRIPPSVTIDGKEIKTFWQS